MAPQQMVRAWLRGGVLSVAVVLMPLPWARGAAAPLPVEPAERREARVAALPEAEVRCCDGSVLKVKVLEESLTLKTPYGTLVIPFDKVKDIEAAHRTPDELARKIAGAIADLGSA